MSYGKVYEPKSDPWWIHGVSFAQCSTGTTLSPPPVNPPAPSLMRSGSAALTAQLSTVRFPVAKPPCTNTSSKRALKFRSTPCHDSLRPPNMSALRVTFCGTPSAAGLRSTSVSG